MTDAPDGQVYVTVGMDPEYEQLYVNRALSPDDGDGPHSFTFPVDTELWDRYETTLNAWQAANDAVIAATPIDPETGRLKECCPEWQGSYLPGHSGVRVMLAQSGNQEEWPLHDHALSFERTRQDAQQVIDVLPEEFYVHIAGQHFQKVHRKALFLVPFEQRGYATECERCGWPRTDHAKHGEPRVIDMPQSKNGEEE